MRFTPILIATSLMVAVSAPRLVDAKGSDASAVDLGRSDVKADYMVGPEDVLELGVLKYGDLNGSLTVRPDGMITVPLIGEVRADGRTVEQISAEITRRMKEFIPDPRVSLRIGEVNSIKVYVTGRVASPGMFSVGSPITVLQAIAMAKGFTPWARETKITLVRGQTGKRVRINYKKVVQGKQENLTLYPGDTVVVP